MIPTILWLRNDLRLADNSALAAAIKLGGPVIPVFIWSPEECDGWSPGAASKWWLHQALQSLNDELGARCGRLIFRSGESLAVLRELIRETGAKQVYWNRRYEGPLRQVDAHVKRELRRDAIGVESFNSALLNEPHTVAAGAGQPYKVYTPYWKKVKDREIEASVIPQLDALQFPVQWPDSDPLESFELMPLRNWTAGMESRWNVSEAGAQQRLNEFLDGAVATYHVDRDRPDFDGTSSLAPYLRWGLIGPRQIVTALKESCDMTADGPSVYLKEIYWREFAYNVLYHFPDTPNRPLRVEYTEFPWENDDTILKRWQQGQTGYPIVDAGMRQLWQTGWMHNRVRMIVSSFLVKHLLQGWQFGARWFWDTLVDADLASNTLGWQWSGGCGADAAPYFRVFNPILQGQKFDPEGAYVKRYVPELQKVPTKYIHEPWTASPALLEAKGAASYPLPIIDHAAGRARALAALAKFKA
jgi:deoxyribodipyrimidine photo-lyase